MGNWAFTRGGRITACVVIACTIGGAGIAADRGWLPWQGGDRDGRLELRVSSIPKGEEADVTVRGPEGLSRHFTGSDTLAGIRPGRYTITAGPVRGAKQDLYPPRLEQTVTVRKGSTATAEVEYNTVVPHTTKVLDAQHLGLVDDIEGDTLTFDTGSGVVTSLRTGDVIVAGVGPHTPTGLLRKVTNVRRSDGKVRVTTQQATLRDAVPEGHIDLSNAPLLSPEQAQQEAAAGARKAAFYSGPGLSETRPLLTVTDTEEEPGSTEIGGDGTFSMVYKTTDPEDKKNREEFGDEKDDNRRGALTRECAWTTTSPLLAQTQFTAKKPTIDFIGAWNTEKLQAVRWTVSGAQTAGLGAEANAAEMKCDMRWTYPIKPIQVGVVPASIGPIPLVITVHSSMVGIAGLGGKLAFKVSQKADFKAGIEYTNGKTQGIHHFTNRFDLDKPPTFELEGSLKAGVRLSFGLYGVTGPYLDLTPGVKIVEKDEISRQPGTAKLELRAGLYTSAGIDFEPFGFKENAVEITDLFHIDKVLYTKTWQESAADKAAKEAQTDCPASGTTTAAVTDLDAAQGAEDLRVTARKCWRDWAVIDWVPSTMADRVSATVFKRAGDQLTPALSMLGSTGPASAPERVSQCAQLKTMRVPESLLDYLCSTATGSSARAAFDPASARVFSEYTPALSNAELAKLKGPLRAVQVCANCGPEGGDGSAQEILLFYSNRYVGMVPAGTWYSSRTLRSQDGTTVTSRVKWAKPDDPVCCPTGETVIYQHVWRNHQLQYTESKP